MQFRVTRRLSSRDTTFDPASGAALRGRAGQGEAITGLVDRGSGTLGSGVHVDLTRQLVLVEVEGPGGPVEVLLNNTRWDGVRPGTDQPAGGPGASVTDGMGNIVTEVPRVGSTEVWEIMNLTQDAHPIHLHLIQFQLMNRQAIASSPDPSDPTSTIYDYRADYDARFPGGTYEGLHPGATDADATWGPATYPAGTLIPAFGPPMKYSARNDDGAVGGNPAFSRFLVGPTLPPEPGETGWKDTIKAYPGTVTRIVARWAPQDTAIGTSRSGHNLFPFDASDGPGYVWHCHILDHEDNEMMRPLRIA